MTHLDRRNFITTGAALSASTLVPMPALALNGTQARNLVDGIVSDINRVIASGKSENAMIRDFENIFKDYADTPYIAAFALGNDRRRATNGQIRAFTQAFNGYVARKYGRRFREFIGGEIVVQSERSVNSFIEVETTAILRGQSPFRVDFHVNDRPGRPVFFNIIIEGVNMLLTERTEIGSILDRRGGDIDAMIADLRNA